MADLRRSQVQLGAVRVKEAFDCLACFALKFGLLNFDPENDQAVRVVLNKEFASAGFRVLVSDPLNLSSECSPRHGRL
jgi:hypothetical protein